MNQRKLVGVLSIVLLAILFMVVGCGDGKHQQSRTAPRKRIPPGKAFNPVNPNSKEGKEKAQALNQVQQTLDASINGSSIANLENGDYVLQEIVSHANYMNTRTSNTFAYVRKSNVRMVGSQPTLELGALLGSGLDANSPDSEGRAIQIPINMTVTGGNPAASLSKTFSTKIVPQGAGKMNLADELGDQSSSVSLISIIANPNNGGNNGGAIIRQQKLGNKTATLWIIKAVNGSVAIRVQVDEKSQASGQQNLNAKTANEALSRDMVFVYSFKAANPGPAQGQQQSQTTQQPQQQQQQQQTPQAPVPGQVQTDPADQRPSADVLPAPTSGSGTAE